MTRKFLLASGLCIFTAVALAFIAVRVPFGIDPIDVVNIRNLQHAIGAEEITGIRQGDLVLGSFNSNWYALFVKISNFSSLQFAQISSAWRYGDTPPFEVCFADPSVPNCGDCRVINPRSTLLMPDGSVRDFIADDPTPLLERSTGADGQIFVSDRVRLSDDGDALHIDHAGAHPPNHNFAPTPVVKLQSVKVDNFSAASRGYAAITFSKTGDVLNMQVFPNSGRDSSELRDGLAAAIKTEFVDQRHHIHTVYASYTIVDANLDVTGSIVTLPRCCSVPICYPRVCPYD